MEVAANPQATDIFKAFEHSLTFKVPENAVKYRNLAILAIILLGVGFTGGWILGGEQTLNDGEIAPQPVRMLLSGMTIIAIAVLLVVNVSAKVAASNVEVGAVSTSAAVANNKANAGISGNRSRRHRSSTISQVHQSIVFHSHFCGGINRKILGTET
ncbi:hypothetical protein [Myxosarcina sp. GI1(2024)]